MGSKTAEEMRGVVERHVELWNTGDKDAWLASWRSVTTGEPSMEDPVGTPIKRGWDFIEEAWDVASQSGVRLTIKTLYVCGSTVAVVIGNDGSNDGVPFSMDSIELYHFHDDGSMHSQTYWDPAAGASDHAEFTTTTGEPV
jgi:ketosteroid isomerase-like protein